MLYPSNPEGHTLQSVDKRGQLCPWLTCVIVLAVTGLLNHSLWAEINYADLLGRKVTQSGKGLIVQVRRPERGAVFCAKAIFVCNSTEYNDRLHAVPWYERIWRNVDGFYLVRIFHRNGVHDLPRGTRVKSFVSFMNIRRFNSNFKVRVLFPKENVSMMSDTVGGGFADVLERDFYKKWVPNIEFIMFGYGIHYLVRADHNPWPLLNLKLLRPLPMVPDVDAQHPQPREDGQSLCYPLNLFPSTGLFPRTPYGPFTAIIGIGLGLFGAICFRICLSSQASWPEFFGSLGIAVLGVVVFHIGRCL